MIIECSSCHARYQYDEDRFERKPSKKIKCAKCSTVFEIHNPAYSAAKEDAPGEMTYTRREAPKKKPEVTEESSGPSSVTSPSPPPKPQLPEGKRLSIAIINGPDAGSVYRIDRPRVVIGRSGADLNINDSESSRHHAALEVRDTVYVLEDLKSTNGTLVDGQKITAPVELQNHSEFQIGSSTMMLIITEDV